MLARRQIPNLGSVLGERTDVKLFRIHSETHLRQMVSARICSETSSKSQAERKLGWHPLRSDHVHL